MRSSPVRRLVAAAALVALLGALLSIVMREPAWALLCAVGAFGAAAALSHPARFQSAETAPTDGVALALATPALRFTGDSGEALEALSCSLQATYEVRTSQLWLEDPSTETLRLVASRNASPADCEPVSLSGTALGQSASTGLAALAPVETWTTPRGSSTLWRFILPVSAEMARGITVIELLSTEQPELSRLAAMADPHIATLASALAIHVARTETEAARLLFEAAQELSKLLDAEAIAHTALSHAMRIAGADNGSMMLVDPESGRLRITAAVGLPRSVVQETSLAFGDGIAGWVAATGQPVVVEDLGKRGGASRRHGIRSAVSVPVADDSGLLGVLNVGSRRFAARFSASTSQALQSLGGTAAVALRNARAVEATQDVTFDTLLALALAMESKDPYSRGGTGQVVELAEAVGKTMDLTAEESAALRAASLLHDIGMSAVGSGVALSDRPLSTVEQGLLKLHPSIAADILSHAPALKNAVPIVYHHHERFDGTGYGLGIAGEGIPLGARILAVVDAYVAMTSERPYRRAMSHDAAVRELREAAGTQFDPRVVSAFIGLSRARGISNASQ